MMSRPIAFQCSPIPEPRDDKVVPSPVPFQLKDFSLGSLSIPISSSSPTPDKNPLSSKKGKEPCLVITPVNSPASSPTNLCDSDLDFLLRKKSLKLEPLTIHKPKNHASSIINPASAKNITVRKKHRGGSRHFRGRTTVIDNGVRNLSLVDVPIYDMSKSQPLRASAAGESSK